MSFLLASGGDKIKLWDTGDNYSLVEEYNPHAGNISSLAWSHDNASLASASSVGDKISIKYLQNTAQHSSDIGLEEQRTCLAYNSMSRYIMGGGPDGLVHIWDLKTQKLKKTYKGHKAQITTMQFNYNDSVITSGSEAGQIYIHSVVTGVGLDPLVLPKEQAVRQIQYSHFKKNMLASASDDGSIVLWDTTLKRLMHSYDRAHKAPAMGLVFSPPNEMLMMSIGLDKKIVCYDVIGKTAVKTMTAESPLTAIDLMADGATLAVGSTRGKIYIYDLRQGATPIHTISAHKSSVQSLKFQSNLQHKSNVGGKPKSSVPAQAVQQSSTADPNKLNNNLIPSYQQPPELQKISTSAKLTAAKSPSFGRISPMNYGSTSDEIFSPLGETGNVTSGRPQDVDEETCSPTLPSRPAATTSNFTNNQHKLYDLPDTGESSNHLPTVNFYRGRTEAMSTSVSSQSSAGTEAVKLDSSARSSSAPRELQPTPKSSAAPRLDFSPPTRLSNDHGAMHNGASKYNIDTSNKKSATSSTSSSIPFHSDTAVLSTAIPAASATAGATAAVDTQPQAFQADFIRSVVQDSLEDLRDELHNDIVNLHMDMLKQFIIQESSLLRVVQEHSINEELLAENVRLKEEIRRLKKKF